VPYRRKKLTFAISSSDEFLLVVCRVLYIEVVGATSSKGTLGLISIFRRELRGLAAT